MVLDMLQRYSSVVLNKIHKVPVNAYLNTGSCYRFPLKSFNFPSDATNV